jgi:hypothetical protein
MGWENTPAVYVEKRDYEAYRDRDIRVSRERERQMTLLPCSGYTRPSERRGVIGEE